MDRQSGIERVPERGEGPESLANRRKRSAAVSEASRSASDLNLQPGSSKRRCGWSATQPRSGSLRIRWRFVRSWIWHRALLLVGATSACLDATVAFGATVTVLPDADTFLRSLAPANNYGAGGALSVSGASAENGAGEQNGQFDTLMRFPMSNLVASLDATLGGHDWVVTQVRLFVSEMAAPDNAIFNIGVGAFEVRWIGADGWLEGSGKPLAPTTDGVAWQDLPLLLNSNVDRSLGFFTNSGANGRLNFTLGMPDSFVADLRSSGELSVYLTAATPQIGFTFNSRNFGNLNTQPALEVNAEPNPRPVIDNVRTADGNIIVGFGVTTNWTYRLQRSGALGDSAEWTDVLTVPATGSITNIEYVDGLTNSRAFYRLLVSQEL